jgi:hypothetical protein
MTDATELAKLQRRVALLERSVLMHALTFSALAGATGHQLYPRMLALLQGGEDLDIRIEVEAGGAMTLRFKKRCDSWKDTPTNGSEREAGTS